MAFSFVFYWKWLQYMPPLADKMFRIWWLLPFIPRPGGLLHLALSPASCQDPYWAPAIPGEAEAKGYRETCSQSGSSLWHLKGQCMVAAVCKARSRLFFTASSREISSWSASSEWWSQWNWRKPQKGKVESLQLTPDKGDEISQSRQTSQNQGGLGSPPHLRT